MRRIYSTVKQIRSCSENLINAKHAKGFYSLAVVNLIRWRIENVVWRRKRAIHEYENSK